MNQNELEKMLHFSNEVRKLVIGSRECIDKGCDSCGYYAICNATALLHNLIWHEYDKYDAKGELKHDNN